MHHYQPTINNIDFPSESLLIGIQIYTIFNKYAELPSNPFKAIGEKIEQKTLGEFMDVSIYPILCQNGLFGVEAKILTNRSAFTGSAAFDIPIIRKIKDAEEEKKVRLNSLLLFIFFT